MVVSTILLIPGLFVVCWACLDSFQFLRNDGSFTTHSFMDVFSCICFGLVAGLIIGYVTEIMTSYEYKPVK